jgi:hypothetical protein
VDGDAVTSIPTTVLTDEHVAGYAELLETAAITDGDTQQIAAALRATAERAGLQPPAVRGLRDPFVSLVERLRGRRVETDHGVHDVQVPWFEFHVPRGAAGSLRWTKSEAHERTFSLAVLSAGAGSGRKVSFTVDAELPERKSCVRFMVGAKVHVRSYTSDQGERLDSDIVALTNRTLVAWPDCPFCAAATGDVDELDFELGQAIDLTRHDAPYRETFRYSLSGESHLDLGASIPLPVGADSRIGLSVSRTVELSCEAAFEFAPGAEYQPYWRADDGGASATLPYWSHS